MTKAIFISGYRLSFPGGGGILSRAYYYALKEYFNEDMFLISSEEDRNILYPKDYRNFLGIPKSNVVTKIKNTTSLKCADRLSPHVDYFIKNQTNKDTLLFINGANIGRFCKISKEKGIKKIFLFHHNIEKLFIKDNTSNLMSFFWAKIYERNQLIGYKNATYNLFLTENDKKICENLYGNASGECITIPIFLPPDKSSVPDINEEINFKKRFNLIILGTLNLPQIIDPSLSFINEIGPILKKKFPEINIIFAGYRPSKKLIDIIRKNNLNIIQDPKDTNGLLKNADLFLSITDKGSGKKIKIMEPLRWGIPIISHRLSLIGYNELHHKKYIFSYKDQKEIIEIINHLYKKIIISIEERKKIQKLFIDNYTFVSGEKAFSELLSLKLK